MEKRRSCGDHAAEFQYLKRAYGEAGQGFFLSGALSDKIKSNRYKLKTGKSRLDIGKDGETQETSSPGRLWMPQLWKCSKPDWMES